MGLTLDQAYDENTLLKDLVTKNGISGGYETPRRAQLNSRNGGRPPPTAGSVGRWSEFSHAPGKFKSRDVVL